MSAQILIIPPAADPRGEAAGFVRRCVLWGLDFYFESGDRLPDHVPSDIPGVRAVFVDSSRVQDNRAALDAYRSAGARVYPLTCDADASLPNATASWAAPKLLHMATVDAGLTPDHPDLRRRLLERDPSALYRQLLQRQCAITPRLWYDATAYHWDVLLDASEIGNDAGFADLVYDQVRSMMREVPNDLNNCDCIAPFRPMLRLATACDDRDIIRFVTEHVDRYIEQTPRYRGCLVNFNAFTNHVRTEVLWQVLPSILMLARVTGRRDYAELVWDQFGRFRDLLFDDSAGMWRHGIGPGGRTDAFWARGVGFTLLANLLLLENTDPNEPAYALLRHTFHAGCRVLPPLQTGDGFFRAVVDAPHTPTESSGTAFIAATLMRARRLGHIEQTYASVERHAHDAVLSRIWDGYFPGHMVATTVSHVPGYYRQIALSDVGWAHFALRSIGEHLRNAAREVACR